MNLGFTKGKEILAIILTAAFIGYMVFTNSLPTGGDVFLVPVVAVFAYILIHLILSIFQKRDF